VCSRGEGGAWNRLKDPAPAIVEAWPAPWLGWNPTTADHCISGGAGQCPVAWPRGWMWGPRLASHAQTPGAVKLQSRTLLGLVCRLPRVRSPAFSKMTRQILGAPPHPQPLSRACGKENFLDPKRYHFPSLASKLGLQAAQNPVWMGGRKAGGRGLAFPPLLDTHCVWEAGTPFLTVNECPVNSALFLCTTPAGPTPVPCPTCFWCPHSSSELCPSQGYWEGTPENWEQGVFRMEGKCPNRGLDSCHPQPHRPGASYNEATLAGRTI